MLALHIQGTLSLIMIPHTILPNAGLTNVGLTNTRKRHSHHYQSERIKYVRGAIYEICWMCGMHNVTNTEANDLVIYTK
jgi:hypothetical protein